MLMIQLGMTRTREGRVLVLIKDIQVSGATPLGGTFPFLLAQMNRTGFVKKSKRFKYKCLEIKQTIRPKQNM